MNLLQDIVTYIRRIIKSPSNTVISDALLIDYVNRFWIHEVDARLQLFDLKTKYQFQTVPGYDQYNMPMYGVQTEEGPQYINYYPIYQGFSDPVYINGIQVSFQTQKNSFFNMWPNVVQQMNVVATGNGGSNYTFRFPIAPNNSSPISTPFQYILRGHVDIQGIISLINASLPYQDPPVFTSLQAETTPGTISIVPAQNVFPAVFITSNLADGSSVVVSDSGQFLLGNQNYGLLMSQVTAPNASTTLTSPQSNTPLSGGYSKTMNTINYYTGEVNVKFPSAISPGVNINAQCFLFQTGLPRGILYNNNTITFRSPPDKQYLVEIDAYLTPAGFLSTSSNSIQFAYMCEYIARGAARKILSDTGDIEQFQFYEPLFLEQEQLVWKRSQRQWTSTRTQTIYSQGLNQGYNGFNNTGSSM